MIFKRLLMEAGMATLSFLVTGCAISEQNATKTAPIGFITTPASYYSSAKARYLGTKYKENLDRLAERIVRNPKTASLQFANNIASVGGIGFFTHSATNSADERFLEVIVSAPETFESKGDLNTKVLSVFSAYGKDLLSILAADPDIYQEKEVSGYGLNLTWKSLVPDSKGTRVALERAVIYVAKDKVRGFLHQEIDQNKFLADAVIFTAADNGPMNLVSYRKQDPRLDTRLPIHEESLVVPQIETRAESRLPSEPRRETVEDTLPSSPAAGDTRSTGSASDAPMALVKQQSLEGKREEQAPVSKSTETTKDPGAVRQSRDGSRDRPPEATKRSDHEAMIQEPAAEPRSVASKTQDMSTAEPSNTTKVSEKSFVTKRLDEPSEFKKAEARADTPPIQKVDRDREVKFASDMRKSDSSTPAPEKAVRVGETAKAAAANAAHSQEGTVGNLASQTSRPALKSADELLALQKSKASEILPKAKTGVGAQSKALEGYIIQLAFMDRGNAQRWAETMERRGYAVSVTEAGGMESVRVRVGNFPVREEADRQLMSLKQEGLRGIVVNLPQAYRPDTRAPSPEKSETQ